jgi:excisionase family DNA binding protein
MVPIEPPDAFGYSLAMTQEEIPETKRVFTLKEIADMYGVQKMTVKRRVWDGRLPAFRIGREFRVLREDALSERTEALMAMTRVRADTLERQQVYFIGGETGPVKIGKAMNPEGRLRDLQCGYPFELKILALVEGSTGVEQGYHRQFAHCRLNGEWFERTPEIEAEIARLYLAEKAA